MKSSSLRKRMLMVFFGIAIVLIGVNSYAQFAGGDGSEESPWQVSNVNHLGLLRNYLGEEHANKYFIQTANIDVSGEPNWVPIAQETGVRFHFKYDGGDFEIRNVRRATRLGNFGFFGYGGEGCVLENVKLRDINVTVNQHSGALVCQAVGIQLINCSVTGSINRLNAAQGGMIGSCTGNSNIHRCWVDLTMIEGGSVAGQAGSIVGRFNSTGSITECYGVVEMTWGGANPPVGGLIGQMQNGSVSNCYVTGSISTAQPRGRIGGFIGDNSNRPVTNCYAVVRITSDTPDPIGGFIAQGGAGSVTNCYWNTELSAIGVSPGGGEPLNTRQMLDRDNFVRWDFDGEEPIWRIDEDSIPYLAFTGDTAPEHCRPSVSLPPTDLEAQVSEDHTRIDLTWEPPSVMEPLGYRIYRDNQLISGPELIEEEEYSDRNAANWRMYSYTVRAVYQIGGEPVESTDSAAATAIIRIFNAGNGTPEDPNIVETTQQFDGIRYGLDECYRLNNDLNLQAFTNWLPIGEATFPFTGEFDGANFEISNLRRNTSLSNFGLFGQTSNAVIKNVHLINVSVYGNSSSGVLTANAANTRFENCTAQGSFQMMNAYKGGIAGQSSGNTSFYRCGVDLTMTDNGAAGRAAGIVGYHAATGVIEQCYAYVNMTSRGVNNPAAAGIVAQLSNGSVRDCYAFGVIRSTDAAGQYGGVVGTGTNRPISNCYAVVSSDIAGGTFGGVVGAGTPATVVNCYWDSEATGVRESPGGGESRMTRQMVRPYDNNTYTEWDFDDIWANDLGDINDGYPIFAYQFTATYLDAPIVTIDLIDREGTRYRRLQWEAIESANSYKIYASANPYLPVENWNMIAHIGRCSYEEAIDNEETPIRFFLVRAYTADPPDGR